jgi:hypothetical protein
MSVDRAADQLYARRRVWSALCRRYIDGRHGEGLLASAELDGLSHSLRCCDEAGRQHYVVAFGFRALKARRRLKLLRPLALQHMASCTERTKHATMKRPGLTPVATAEFDSPCIPL